MSENLQTPFDIKNEFPSLYYDADRQAKSAQKWHVSLNASNLIITSLSAALLVYSIAGHPVIKKWFTITSSILLFATILLFWSLRFKRFDSIWFQSRAVAETVLSHAWCYMTGTERYPTSLSTEIAEANFMQELFTLLEGHNTQLIPQKKSDEVPQKPQITKHMKQIREASVTERRKQYEKLRLEAQRKWYFDKSLKNKRVQSRLFNCVMICQLLALASSLYLIHNPESPWRWTGLLTTIVSSLMAWMQLKRHQEMGQSYNMIAQKLGMMKQMGEHVKTDEELNKYVIEAESIMTKEQSMWLAKRT